MGGLSRRRGSPSCTQRTVREKPTWALTLRATLGRSRIAWSLRCLTCLLPRSGLSNMQLTPLVPSLGLTRSSWQSVLEVQSPETPVEEWTRMMTKLLLLGTFTLLYVFVRTLNMYLWIEPNMYLNAALLMPLNVLMKPG